jgi:hypothetical protein
MVSKEKNIYNETWVIAYLAIDEKPSLDRFVENGRHSGQFDRSDNGELESEE